MNTLLRAASGVIINKFEDKLKINIKYKMCRCSHNGCRKNGVFGYIGLTNNYCKIHKEPDMIDVINKKCEYNGCTSQPSYDFEGSPGKFCKTHKIPGMIDVKHKRCLLDNCNIRPSFAFPGNKPIYCLNHKENCMIDVTKISCHAKNCNIIPTFDYPGGKAKFCNKHKKDGMVNVKGMKCLFDGCKIRPSFGTIKGKPLYCLIHKDNNMINVVSDSCVYSGCETRPSFGIIKGKALYCAVHKEINMINVKDKYCKNPECNIIPTYGLPNTKDKIYCVNHKSDTMVDLSHPTCQYNNCVIRPCYNYIENSHEGGIYCLTHKKSDMVDVVNKICDENGCNNRAYFGLPGKISSKCSIHKTSKMLRKSRIKCLECNEQAIYGIKGIMKHCENHSKEGEINLVESKCISCHLPYMLNENSQCEACDPKIWNNVKLKKQKDLIKYLDSCNLHGSTTDKIIDSGVCGKERPDRVYDLIDKIVIIECDENQHKDRNCECEQIRMINITQSFGGLPVYFIRWNPDNYKPKNKIVNIEKISNRYKLLSDILITIMESRIDLPISLCSVIYLYYDNWDGFSSEKWKVLLEYN